MKIYPILALFISSLFFGCATGSGPTARPFVFIANAKKVGDGPRATSPHEVTVHYKNIQPGKYEIKIGYGYVSDDPNLQSMVHPGSGLFAAAFTQILDKPNGEISVTIRPFDQLNPKGTLTGKVHATLAEYPHGKEWVVVAYDIFALTPD